MHSVNSLALSLMKLIRPLMRVSREEFRLTKGKGKLTFVQYRILSHLSRAQQPAMKQVSALAEHHGVSQPAMSKMIDALVRAGHLSREAHSSDRRRLVLRLTPKALALVNSIEGRVLARIEALFTAAKPQERKLIQEALQQAHTYLTSEIPKK